jgi:hypothetical protein
MAPLIARERPGSHCLKGHYGSISSIHSDIGT